MIYIKPNGKVFHKEKEHQITHKSAWNIKILKKITTISNYCTPFASLSKENIPLRQCPDQVSWKPKEITADKILQ